MINRPKLAVVALACVAALPLGAQRAETPRIGVMTFQIAPNTEREAGTKVAEAVRDRIGKDISDRQLFAVPFEEVKDFLEQSGFPADSALAPQDEFLLAKSMRADMYLTGTVTKTAKGYRVEPRLVLTRNQEMPPSQPLPVFDVRKADDAGRPITNALRAAMQQLVGEKKCIVAFGQRKTADALAAARAATAAYPQATLSRLCEMNVFWALAAQSKTRADSLAYADSALVVARALAQVDPKSVPALRIQSAAYDLKGDSANARQALLSLASANPSDLVLIDQIVNDLARTGYIKDALPLARELVDSNPGDPKSLHTAFLVFVHANDWKGVAETGPQLLALDTTAAADSMFYVRMATAYDSLHQPQQAAAQFAVLTKRFPKSTAFWMAYAQSLRKAGQTQQADAALQQAAALDPALALGLALQSTDSLFKAGNYDSVFAILQRSVAAPDANKSVIGTYALNYGNQLYGAATSHDPLVINEFGRTLRFLKFANANNPSNTAQVLIAASNTSIAGQAANDAQKTKSCDLARAGRDAYTEAKAAIAAVGTDAEQAATIEKLNTALSQIKPALDSEIKAYCK